MTRLPVRLGKDPLVSVIFEIRFGSDLPASKILPGIIFSQFACSNLAATPQAEIPDSFRVNDPNLRYAPLVTLQWEDYQIQIGDRALQLVCEMPYKGWDAFRSKILELLTFINSLNILKTVERYSLKYTDIIDYSVTGEAKDFLNIGFQFGNSTFNIANTHVRTETNYNDIIVLMQLAGQARAEFATGEQKVGFLIDIDCIRALNNIDFPSALSVFSGYLDDMHELNKNIFFGYLTPKCLDYLEAEYE